MPIINPSGGSGGGGSSPWSLVTFAFAFNTAGLAAGVTAYTPTVGQILYDAWIEVLTAFDGTTPLADISQFTGALAPIGLWGNFGFPVALVGADTVNVGGGPATSDDVNKNASLGAVGQNANRPAPSRFTTTNPLLLVVSQTGQRNGAAIGGTAGSATLRLLILTP